MIKLTFAIGGNIRRVFIDKRVITLMTAETGFQPIQMDLDKLESKSMQKKIKKQMGKDGLSFMKEVALLNTEEEMEQDVIKDFQKTGWRCVKRE